QPLRFDIELARGVVLTGRVIDKATGKGVSSGIRYVPLPDNKYFGTKPGYDSYRHERLMTPTYAKWRFRLVATPGAGSLLAQAHGKVRTSDGVEVNPYKQAVFDPAEGQRVKVTEDGADRFFIAAGNSYEFLAIENACKVLEPAEDAGTVTCD